jgi:DNA-binding transcriptional regulator/RsmH inhibitor MraZ
MGAISALDGAKGLSMGNKETSLVHIFGHREILTLDARGRFRIPDELARELYQEYARAAGQSNLPPRALQRLSFYLVPGTRRRIFLYPPTNIHVAVERFENPPAGQDPEQVRAARDYFYGMMCFAEADRQNRVQIPDHLREHAGINGKERQILISGHNLWLTVTRSSAAREMQTKGMEALENVGPSVLDRVDMTQPPSSEAEQ